MAGIILELTLALEAYNRDKDGEGLAEDLREILRRYVPAMED